MGMMNDLCQLVTQTGFREPLEGRTRNIAKASDRVIYEELHPSESVKHQRIRISVYFVAGYLALC